MVGFWQANMELDMIEFQKLVGLEIITKRDYGPFLNKPNLPAGKYKIKSYSLSIGGSHTGIKIGHKFVSGITIENDGFEYMLEDKDLDVLGI